MKNDFAKRAGVFTLALSLSLGSAQAAQAQTLSACPVSAIPAAAQPHKLYLPAVGNMARKTALEPCSAEPYPTLAGATAIARTQAAYNGIDASGSPDVEYITYGDGHQEVEVTFGTMGCWVWVSYRMDMPGYVIHAELNACAK